MPQPSLRPTLHFLPLAFCRGCRVVTSSQGLLSFTQTSYAQTMCSAYTVDKNHTFRRSDNPVVLWKLEPTLSADRCSKMANHRLSSWWPAQIKIITRNNNEWVRRRKVQFCVEIEDDHVWVRKCAYTNELRELFSLTKVPRFFERCSREGFSIENKEPLVLFPEWSIVSVWRRVIYYKGSTENNNDKY